MRRMAGATFGFGGKLAMVSPPRTGKIHSTVTIKSIPTNPQLIEQSKAFEEVMQDKRFHEFCYGAPLLLQ
jgi:hypothetical protein